MHTTPLHRFRFDSSSGRLSGDKGYVIALTALLMVPLTAFTALAVDMGAWYARAAQIQRASDAAALAGVVKLPDIATARSAACANLVQNGFANVGGGNGCGGSSTTLSADIQQVPDPTYKLKVDLRDSKANQFFSKLFKPSGVSVDRASIGQYIKPTTMGSARNFVGTGNLTMGSASSLKENFWLAVSGGCSSKEQGERFSALSDANYTTANNPAASKSYNTCTVGGNVVANTEYIASYYYAVSFGPTFAGGSTTVQIYSPSSGCGSITTENDSANIQTTFQMLNNDSPLPANASPIGAPLAPANGANCGWTNLYTISSPQQSSTYYVKVTADPAANGSNQFAIRASTGAWAACSSDNADVSYTFNANCPNVSGYGNMGVYANQTGTSASFYLASTGVENNGKVMQIEMWDPGEGAWALQILDPAGVPHAFSWSVLCWDTTAVSCSDTAPTGGWSGNSTNYTLPTTPTGTSLSEALDLLGSTRNVSTSDTTPEASPTCNFVAANPCAWLNPAPGGTGAGGGWNKQPWGYRTSASKYNDRLLRIQVQLPNDIAAAYPVPATPGAYYTWWKVKYWTGTSAVTDRTTWVVTMKGSPVRLVPE